MQHLRTGMHPDLCVTRSQFGNGVSALEMLGMQSDVAVYESADGEIRMIVAILQDRSAVNRGDMLGGPEQAAPLGNRMATGAGQAIRN